MGGHGIVQVMGEVTTNAYVDIPAIVGRVAGKVGCNVNLVKQSNDIAKGVDIGGAGDQGIMVGYACDENEAMIPHELYLARSLCKYLFFRNPQDGKTQVTTNNGIPITIVASWANTEKAVLLQLVQAWLTELKMWPSNIQLLINPAGDWYTSGFEADTGLTGRKLCVDNYGPRIPLGGGAFSGKDGTKVDRSGAYKARQVAVQILKSRHAKECLVYLAYAIGEPKPVQMTCVVDGQEILMQEIIPDEFCPQNIIEDLKLRSPCFAEAATWGHFGNGFLWDGIK